MKGSMTIQPTPLPPVPPAKIGKNMATINPFRGARFVREGRQQEANNAFRQKDFELRDRTQQDAQRAKDLERFNKNLKDMSVLASQAVRAAKDQGDASSAEQPVLEIMAPLKDTAKLLRQDPKQIDAIVQQILRTPSTAEVDAKKAATAGAIKSAEREKFGAPRDIGGQVIAQKGDSGVEKVITKPTAPLIVNQQEKKQSQIIGATLGAVFSDSVKASKDAHVNKNRVARGRQLLKGVTTGATQPAAQLFKKYARDLGVDLKALRIKDDTPAADAIQAITVDFALDAVQRTKGAISDKEMALFIKSAAGLSKSPEGNQLLLDVIERNADLAILSGQFTRQYMKEHDGKLDVDFFDELDNFHADNPLFTDDINERIAEIQSGQPQSPQSTQAPQGQLDLNQFLQ